MSSTVLEPLSGRAKTQTQLGLTSGLISVLLVL